MRVTRVTHSSLPADAKQQGRDDNSTVEIEESVVLAS